MAGSSHGLGEISHTGQMRMVGGKAASFINKKFFHPSSLRNQERMWGQIEAAAGHERQQIELAKRREEELAVERMKKQMYLAGQGDKSDAALFAKDGVKEGDEQALEAAEAVAEQKRRKAMLRRTKDGDKSDDEDREPVQSSYEEDKFENGHWTVWGSWYEKEKERWGFRCCKGLIKEDECPVAADAPAVSNKPKISKRKLLDQGDFAKRARAEVEEKRGDEKAKEAYEFQLRCDESRGIFRNPEKEEKLDPIKYMAPELLQAVSRKEEEKRKKKEEEAKPKGTGSDYLADLLSDPLGLNSV